MDVETSADEPGGVREREALEQYKSQTTRLVADPRRLTLGDVASSDWLRRFLREYEIFRRSRVTA